jgi:hypothetical protein
MLEEKKRPRYLPHAHTDNHRISNYLADCPVTVSGYKGLFFKSIDDFDLLISWILADIMV